MLNYLSAYVLYPLSERSQGRRIGSKLRAIRQWLARPFAERRQLAQRRLAEVLCMAGCHVPYYRDLFRAAGFDPEKVGRDAAFLQDLPYLDKQTIRAQGERLLHEAIPRGSLQLRKTGGSTGPATWIYYSRRALDWTAAANLWAQHAIGKYPHTREAHLSSRFPEDLLARPLARGDQVRRTESREHYHGRLRLSWPRSTLAGSPAGARISRPGPSVHAVRPGAAH